MAVPAYATDLNDIFLDQSTGFTTLSGRVTFPETDDYIQGASCWSHDPFSSGIEGGVYNSAETIATDDAVFFWLKCDIVPAIATRAAGGMQALIGNASTAFNGYYVRGNDDYVLGGWVCVPVDPVHATADATVGSPNATTAYFGCRWNIPGAGPNKGYPLKIDAMRHGRQVEVTAGEIANPATFESLTTYADNNARRWGIAQGTNTGMTQQGIVYWGTAAAACYSRVSNKTLVFLDTLGFTVTDFTQLIFANASSDIVWDSVVISSLDPLNRGIISVLNNAPVTITNSVIQDINTTADGGSNSVWDGTKWISSDAVTSVGGSFLGCQVLTSNVAANASAFVYNQNADPDGELDGMQFTQGAAAHHAIEFGASIPADITLRDMVFTDFDADTTNGAALHFLDTTGTIDVNLIGMTTPTYKSAGATINFILPAQTLTITGVPTNAEYRLYVEDVTAGKIGTTELQGAESWTGGNITYNYTWTADVDVVLQVIEPGFVEYLAYFTLTATSQLHNVTLLLETNE